MNDSDDLEVCVEGLEKSLMKCGIPEDHFSYFL